MEKGDSRSRRRLTASPGQTACEGNCPAGEKEKHDQPQLASTVEASERAHLTIKSKAGTKAAAAGGERDAPSAENGSCAADSPRGAPARAKTQRCHRLVSRLSEPAETGQSVTNARALCSLACETDSGGGSTIVRMRVPDEVPPSSSFAFAFPRRQDPTRSDTT